MAEEQKAETVPPITFKEFLENVPPGVFECVPDALDSYSSKWTVQTPEIKLYCDSEDCNDMRLFSCKDKFEFYGRGNKLYLTYNCKNCGKSHKIYAIQFIITDDEKAEEDVFYVFKYGERPSFGPPTPNRVLDLMGEHRDDFLKGRTCENQGLGKGAFTYYRNVVEDQKKALIGEIIKVAKILGLSKEDIDTMETAKNETQFSKAVQSMKHLIPESLLIKGHNPLTLLHDALSKGIHPNLTDEECLEYATSIRTVLAALCEKVVAVTKDNQAINAALKQLTGNGGDTPATPTEEPPEDPEKEEV